MLMRWMTLALLIWPVGLSASPACQRLADGDATLGLPDATCTESLLQGGTSQTSCYWVHAYRSADALKQFDALRIAIETCLEADAALPEDSLVNHPDSYDLRQYAGQGVRVALALKDKSGLGQTLVFLSLSPDP